MEYSDTNVWLSEKLKGLRIHQDLIPKIQQEYKQNGSKYAKTSDFSALEIALNESLLKESSSNEDSRIIFWIRSLHQPPCYIEWRKAFDCEGSTISVKEIYYSFLKCVNRCDVLEMERELVAKRRIIKLNTDLPGTSVSGPDVSDLEKTLYYMERRLGELPPAISSLSKILKSLQEKMTRMEQVVLQKKAEAKGSKADKGSGLTTSSKSTSSTKVSSQSLPPKYTVHYRLADGFVMAGEIVKCFKELQANVPNYEFKRFEQEDKSCQLLINFELVDDRIRGVELKQTLAQSLLNATSNNCVWAFICFKPTEIREGTKITNSVQNLSSGFTGTDGAFIRCYLTSEYVVDPTQRDYAGNFLHVLANKEKFKQDVVALIERKKPVTSINQLGSTGLCGVLSSLESQTEIESTVNIHQDGSVINDYRPQFHHRILSVAKEAMPLQLLLVDDERKQLATILIQPSSGYVASVNTKSIPESVHSLGQSEPIDDDKVYSSNSASENLETSWHELKDSRQHNQISSGSLSRKSGEVVVVSLGRDEIPTSLSALCQILSRHEFSGKTFQVEAQDHENWLKLESDGQLHDFLLGIVTPFVDFRIRLQ